MIPTGIAMRRDTLLDPAEIARICAGRVLRRGRAAGRIVTDSRELQAGDCFVALPGAAHDGHDYLKQVFERGAAGAVVCRPVPRERLREGVFVVKVEDTFAALLRMAAEYRANSKARVIGITGSCGKTSTKDMLGEVLDRAMPTIRSPKSYNNHVGVPLTLFQLTAATRAAIVEIGSNAPGEIASLAAVVRPDIGIITRVDESHLMQLESLQGVALEKSHLVAALPEAGLAILNGDDQSAGKMRAATRARVQEVRVDSEADWFATDVRFHGLGTSFRLQGETPVTLPRLGSHNVYNALFTVAAASELGVDLDTIVAGLCAVPATSRRLECKQVGSVSIIDDTYNSNPASARAALLALSGLPRLARRLVVLGEMRELGGRSEALHRELGVDVARASIDLLVTVGLGAHAIADAALAAGMASERVCVLDDPLVAADHLIGELRPGDWLLCKASRGVGLDRLVDDLLARLSAPGG